ncbi:MAG: uroporphyrinogen decarboxylase family protein [Planctomycetota bacterium]
MNSRDTIKALLAGELPQRMGLNEHFWGGSVKSAWDQQGLDPSVTDFGEHFNLDLKAINFFKAPGPRPDLIETIEESDEWVVTRDAWGASFKNWKQRNGTPEHIGFSVTTPEIWRGEYREAFLARDVREYYNLDNFRATVTSAMAGERFVTYSGLFVFEELRKILGDVRMLEAMLLEPEWITDICTCITRKYMEFFELLFTEVGLPDGMHIYEDLGYTAAPFCSPATHRELILPHHKKFFRMCKDYGLPIILHTCGDFRPHLPAIVESGVDCIQAMEAKTGMNVVDIAREYSKDLCFMGNINIQTLESGNRDAIREECLTKLNGMKALRAPYVFMSDHSIPPSVRLTDYEYMLELYRDHCRY